MRLYGKGSSGHIRGPRRYPGSEGRLREHCRRTPLTGRTPAEEPMSYITVRPRSSWSGAWNNCGQTRQSLSASLEPSWSHPAERRSKPGCEGRSHVARQLTELAHRPHAVPRSHAALHGGVRKGDDHCHLRAMTTSALEHRPQGGPDLVLGP